MPVSDELFRQVVREDRTGLWELICRGLQRKPVMSPRRIGIVTYVGATLAAELPYDEFRVCVNEVYLCAGTEHRLIPDIAVVPRRTVGDGFERMFVDTPVPLVVDTWSEMIEGHDLDTKTWQYQARGDNEIWLIHPYERTATTWRRQPDGTYTETVVRGGYDPAGGAAERDHRD